METFLKQIIERKKEELEEAKRECASATLKECATFQEPRRSLIQALAPISIGIAREFDSKNLTPRTTRIIAEIKKASPSKGLLRGDLQPATLAQSYQRGGAAAISVLTERQFFLGELSYLTQVRKFCPLPILRKDFLFDPYQVYEAVVYGADAILLIAAILEDNQMGELIDTCKELGIEPLIEVHTHTELERVLRTEASLIGINNRNLQTFQTDLQTTLELIREIPPGKVVVSESGIKTRADIVLLEEAGVNAFLIGESLVRAANQEAMLKELLGC